MLEMISEDDARYARDLVQAICTQVGPGMPGSPQERERAAMIKTELETHLGPEKVAVEEFTFAPGAFLGSQLISSLFVLASALLNMSLGCLPGVSPCVTAVAALLFSTGAALLLILEFVMGFELVDPLFKKQQSLNVIGTLRKPGSGEVKRLLILSGHHDSALEFTWLRFTGYGYFFPAGHLAACTDHRAGDEPHPAGRAAGGLCRSHPVWNAGMGPAVLSHPAVDHLCYVLHPGRKKRGQCAGCRG